MIFRAGARNVSGSTRIPARAPAASTFILMSALISAAIISYGCVSIEQRSVDDLRVAIPESFTGATELTLTDEGDAGLAQLVSSFADEQLDDLVQEALANNRDLRAAASRVEIALARARIARADRLPSLSAGLSAARQQQVFVGLPIPGQPGPLKTLSTRYGTSIDLAWEADLWGRIRAGRWAAAADAQAAEADLRAARLSLVAQTLRGWFAAIEAERQFELSRETVAAYEGSLRSVQQRYEAGLAAPLDLRLLRSQLAEAQALEAGRAVQRESAVRSLEVLLGRYPQGKIAAIEDLPQPPEAVPVGLPAELIARRPDLVAAERRLFAADARYAQARASLYPSLRLSASGGSTSDALSDLLDGDFSVWSLLGGLTQPLFAGGRLRAGVDLAEASSSAALESFAGQVLRALAEVEIALAADAWLAQQELAVAESAAQARAARELAEDQYRSGVVDVLALLEARRRAFVAESALLSSRRQRLENRIDLHLALGGEFADAPAGETSLPASES